MFYRILIREYFYYLGLIGVSFVLLFTSIWFAQYGLDLSDEGFYLNAIFESDAYDFTLAGTQFGHLYHGFARLLGINIVGLRVLNICSNFFLAYAMFLSLLEWRGEGMFELKIQKHSLALGFASCSLVGLSLQGHWIATPSYNSLALSALLLAVIGLLNLKRRFFSGWIILGLGGSLLFMAKPSSSALMAALVLIYVLATRQFRLFGVLYAGAIALTFLLVSALVIDGSLQDFYNRYALGLHYSFNLGSGHTVVDAFARLASFPMGPRAQIVMPATLVILCLAYFSPTRFAPKAFVCMGLLAMFSSGFVYKNGIGDAYAKEAFIQLLLMCSFWLGCVVVAIMGRARSIRLLSFEEVALLLLLFCLPHVFAFGTNNDIWVQASTAGLFWITSGIVLLSSLPLVERQNLTLKATTLSLLFSAFIVAIILESPYRNPQPLRLNADLVEVGPNQSRLVLDKARARYVSELRQLAINADFEPGEFVIDITGVAPGAVFAIGGKSAGLAWLIGGYSGSNYVAAGALDRMSCEELAEAWVLNESENPHQISKDILNGFGANLDGDYLILGAVSVPPNDLGSSSKDRKHFLLKPNRPKLTALEQCRKIRANSS